MYRDIDICIYIERYIIGKYRHIYNIYIDLEVFVLSVVLGIHSDSWIITSTDKGKLLCSLQL